jgi:glutaconate CoA-transferase subunit A
VVEVAFGAHPTSCYPHYTYDRAHLSEWVKAAATDEGVRDYAERYIHAGGSEEGYREAVGDERLGALGEWSVSDQRWMELLS